MGAEDIEPDYIESIRYNKYASQSEMKTNLARLHMYCTQIRMEQGINDFSRLHRSLARKYMRYYFPVIASLFLVALLVVVYAIGARSWNIVGVGFGLYFIIGVWAIILEKTHYGRLLNEIEKEITKSESSLEDSKLSLVMDLLDDLLRGTSKRENDYSAGRMSALLEIREAVSNLPQGEGWITTSVAVPKGVHCECRMLLNQIDMNGYFTEGAFYKENHECADEVFPSHWKPETREMK